MTVGVRKVTVQSARLEISKQAGSTVLFLMGMYTRSSIAKSGLGSDCYPGFLFGAGSSIMHHTPEYVVGVLDTDMRCVMCTHSVNFINNFNPFKP